MNKTLFFSLLLSGCSVIAAENLMVNPQFTVAAGKELPNGWMRVGKNAKVEIVKSEKGTSKAKLIHTEGNTIIVIGTKGMKSDTSYQLTIPVKAEKGKKYEVFVQAAKPKFQTCSTHPVLGTGDWQLVALPVKMSGFTAAPYLGISTKGAHTLEIGSPVLEENANLIRNRTFFQRTKAGLPAGFSGVGKNVKWKAVVEDGAPTIIVDGADKADKPRIIMVHTPVQAGKKYIFSAEFKAEEEDHLKISFQENKKWKTFESKKMEGNDKWQQISVTFSFPEIPKISYGVISCYGTEPISIRNLSLVEIPSESK